MTSILLSNPFVVPNGPAQAGPDVASTLAIQPTAQTQAGSDKGDSTAFSGSNAGRGNGNQANTVALIQTRSAPARPGDATPNSVINAQAQDSMPLPDFGSNMPKVAMPDPLPTSPFLKSG